MPYICITDYQINMYTIFEETFPELDILIDEEKNLVSGRTPGETENGECFRLLVKEDCLEIICMKYPKQTKCNLSGSYILIKLYEIARKLDKEHIVLSDSSEIHAGHKEPICFYRYYILLHGISWYNKFGYFSDNYRDEFAHNYKLIHSPVNVYGKFREYQLFYKYFPGEELDKMSVNQAFIALDMLWRSKGDFDNDLYELIQFIVLEPPIKYNHRLRLEVKDPKVATLYQKLSAK